MPMEMAENMMNQTGVQKKTVVPEKPKPAPKPMGGGIGGGYDKKKVGRKLGGLIRGK